VRTFNESVERNVGRRGRKRFTQQPEFHSRTLADANAEGFVLWDELLRKKD